MLWIVAVVLFILWALGFFAFHVAGALIHLLLILVVVAVIASFLTGSRNGRTRL